MKLRPPNWLLGSCVLLLTSTALPIFAADDALEEVVVTAQRRTERLQDVPEAITALSGDSLRSEERRVGKECCSRC